MPQPELIPMPFAENATPGTIEPIENTTPPRPQDATWSTGFPQVTMQPLASGGIPPRGQNFNGVLNALSQHIFHVQGGGQYRWSDDHGPYSIGDVLQSDDGARSYVSVVDNNTDNFNTTPSAIGASWMPWSGGAASELVAGLVKIATTAEARALTNDAAAITPKKLGEVLDVTALGRNQTWQDVSASRVLNVNYTNSTAAPIFVVVMTVGPSGPISSIICDGLTVCRTNLTIPSPEANEVVFSSAIIPPGSIYSSSTDGEGIVSSWYELRS